MDNRIFNRTKKTLGILLIVFLVTSVTSLAVNADNGMYDHDNVVQITQLEQINTFLHKGPVFVEMKAQSCKPCQQTIPILEKLAAEYKGKATIASIDIYQSPEVAKYFGGYDLPDAFVIVGIKNGKYVYINDDGTSTLDRSQARIVGLNAGNKNRFEKIIDHALMQQGTNTPMLTGQHKREKHSGELYQNRQNQGEQSQGEQNQGRQNQGGQFPGELFPGEQYLGNKFTDGILPDGLFPGEQYLDGQFSDIELYPGKHLGEKCSGGQNQGGQNQIKQFPIVTRSVGARPVGAKPAIGTGLVTPATPGLITDPTYGVSAPATSGSKHSGEQQNDDKHSGEQHKGKKHSNKQYHNKKYLNEQTNANKNKA
jgi:thiol-disulfide isomerase/thioredoxin